VTKLLTPVAPTNILCVGLNYMRHWEEGAKQRGVSLPENPVIFMKPTSSLNHPDDPIRIPQIVHGEKLDYEVSVRGGVSLATLIDQAVVPAYRRPVGVCD